MLTRLISFSFNTLPYENITKIKWSYYIYCSHIQAKLEAKLFPTEEKECCIKVNSLHFLYLILSSFAFCTFALDVLFYHAMVFNNHQSFSNRSQLDFFLHVMQGSWLIIFFLYKEQGFLSRPGLKRLRLLRTLFLLVTSLFLL